MSRMRRGKRENRLSRSTERGRGVEVPLVVPGFFGEAGVMEREKDGGARSSKLAPGTGIRYVSLMRGGGEDLSRCLIYCREED